MNNYEYDWLVLIGRFQPMHNEHERLIRIALQKARRVLVLIGSADKPRTFKDPFTYDERSDMILEAFKDRVWTNRLVDYIYNDDSWATEVQLKVMYLAKKTDKIGLIGCNKDDSSYYLRLFPQWNLVEIPYEKAVGATELREAYFGYPNLDTSGPLIEPYVSKDVWKYLVQWKSTEEYKLLYQEYQQHLSYKKLWANSPFPPTFNTVDAVVTNQGHVLMVQRKFAPGKGLWALPGGFLDQNETIIQSMIRELKEETGIRVDKAVLLGNLKRTKNFDHPNRSLRGRTITCAGYIPLNFPRLPEVKGSDDAAKAKWIPLAEILQMRDKIFEDHLDIIQEFTGI